MRSNLAVTQSAIKATVIRKVRSRILPFVMILFVINVLDRMNIGFAALTMNKELAITSEEYGFLAGIFFLGYFVFEIPSNLLLHRIGARVWLARILIGWGLVAGLTGFAKTAGQIYICRFLLGKTGLSQIWHMKNKRKLQAAGSRRGGALAHGRVWYPTATYFTAMCAWQGMSLWLPQLMKVLTKQSSNSVIGVLVMIPFVIALTAMIPLARHSDRTLERRYHAAIPLIIGGASLALLATGVTTSIPVTLILWCFAVPGICCFWGPFWALPNEFLVGYSAAAGIGLINCVGNLGGFLGTYAIGAIGRRTGGLQAGLVFLAIVFFATAVMMVALRREGRSSSASLTAVLDPISGGGASGQQPTG